jgi:hypothetical protein
VGVGCPETFTNKSNIKIIPTTVTAEYLIVLKRIKALDSV